jgi:integrase
LNADYTQKWVIIARRFTSGIDLTTVMHLMGHKSIKMTLRYSHLAPSHKAKAMTAIEDKFQGIFSDVDEGGGKAE